MPKDKVVWDVGHQTYIHKILTGRKDRFDTIRQMGGLAGFPRTSESEYDSFDTGHSSTSISAALGMARARDILHKNHKVIAVIGDGALTGGMALEALNDAGISKTDLIVILNDNEMSISKNTGGMSRFLSKLRTDKSYLKKRKRLKAFITHIPLIGKGLYKVSSRLLRSIKSLFIKNMYFEEIGFKYLGPVNGHSIEDLEAIFERAKNIEGPVLIHTVTIKGNGFEPAEENPNKFHSVGPFNLEDGSPKKPKKKDYSAAMGETLVKLAKKDKKIVAITAAMEEGTGLNEFGEKYPSRFFDVEIAEQHGLTLAAGMAIAGLKPVIPIYSSFLQRGYDQLVHDICMQQLPVTICVDRAGCVGNDGETHQGLLDLSYLNTIPHMNVMAPKNYEELALMLEFAINSGKPMAIRYPRGTESSYPFKPSKKIELGKGELLRTGSDLTIVAIGKMVSYAMEVADKLAEDGINAEVINARFAKPLDMKMIEKSLAKTNFLVTIEDNSIQGGLGETIKAELSRCYKTINFAYPDEFIKHGSIPELEKKYGLDVESIYKRIKKDK
jgi:1-deoxy-D-xylulose-5-phosphate synthase